MTQDQRLDASSSVTLLSTYPFRYLPDFEQYVNALSLHIDSGLKDLSDLRQYLLQDKYRQGTFIGFDKLSDASVKLRSLRFLLHSKYAKSKARNAVEEKLNVLEFKINRWTTQTLEAIHSKVHLFMPSHIRSHFEFVTGAIYNTLDSLYESFDYLDTFYPDDENSLFFYRYIKITDFTVDVNFTYPEYWFICYTLPDGWYCLDAGSTFKLPCMVKLGIPFKDSKQIASIIKKVLEDEKVFLGRSAP